MSRKSFVRVSYAIKGSELEQPTVHEVQTAMVHMCICIIIVTCVCVCIIMFFVMSSNVQLWMLGDV